MIAESDLLYRGAIQLKFIRKFAHVPFQIPLQGSVLCSNNSH